MLPELLFENKSLKKQLKRAREPHIAHDTAGKIKYIVSQRGETMKLEVVPLFKLISRSFNCQFFAIKPIILFAFCFVKGEKLVC